MGVELTEKISDMSNTKSSSSSSSSKKQLPRLSVLLSPFPKKDAKNFTEGTVISDTPNESYYVKQSDKKDLVKIINDPTNEILRYLESQQNTVELKREEYKKEESRKRKNNHNDKSHFSSKRSKQ